MKIHKNMTNLEIAELLCAVAASYELINANQNKFKIIAYERAADAVEHLSSEAKDLWDEGKLGDIAGIGPSISEHLSEIFKTGKSRHFESVMKGISGSVFVLMELPGIGTKTAFKLVKELKLFTSKNPISDLEKAAKEGEIAKIEGFGEESQSDILKTIEESRRKIKRYLLPYAENIANEVIKWMKEDQSVVKADALGSIRRKASTIGDIDIAIASNKPLGALERFTRYPKASRVIEKGTRTASIILPGDVQVDLMAQNPKSYGSLLQHFTGSKHHNIALREHALKKGYSLSEYGIKKVKDGQSGIREFSTEEELYKYLSMEWIPPELREDTGELEASLKNQIPRLLESKDIKADLQIHSDFNVETSHDLGESTMEELVEKANNLGYEYIAFTEHNPSHSRHSENQIIDIIKRKKEAIEKLNYSLIQKKDNSVKIVNNRIKKVFNSLEIDILPNGGLAISDKALELLDFALVSIHSSFDQERNIATKRVLSALNHPKVKIFAHPIGRRLNEREGVEYDWLKIFDECKKRNIWLEINADPTRLDLPDFLVKEAIENNVKLTLGTDAHNFQCLDNMQYGIYVARRGWATKENLINYLTVDEFEKVIE